MKDGSVPDLLCCSAHTRMCFLKVSNYPDGQSDSVDEEEDENPSIFDTESEERKRQRKRYPPSSIDSWYYHCLSRFSLPSSKGQSKEKWIKCLSGSQQLSLVIW